jgi:hypothetical protein
LRLASDFSSSVRSSVLSQRLMLASFASVAFGVGLAVWLARRGSAP